jgi:hypothetical protein
MEFFVDVGHINGVIVFIADEAVDVIKFRCLFGHVVEVIGGKVIWLLLEIVI